MSAFEVVIVIVAAAALLYGVAVGLGFIGPVRRTRRGATWIDHPEDVPVEQRPDEDDRSAPLPRRRLRGQPR